MYFDEKFSKSMRFLAGFRMTKLDYPCHPEAVSRKTTYFKIIQKPLISHPKVCKNYNLYFTLFVQDPSLCCRMTNKKTLSSFCSRVKNSKINISAVMSYFNFFKQFKKYSFVIFFANFYLIHKLF